MGKFLCEKNLRDVWCRNESVRAEIGQILHTHAAKLVVEITMSIFFTSFCLNICDIISERYQVNVRVLVSTSNYSKATPVEVKVKETKRA